MESLSTFTPTRRDVLFLLETIDPGLLSRMDTFMSDPELIEGMLDLEAGKLFQRLMDQEESAWLTLVSPRFLFEVLLREAARSISRGTYTVERSSCRRIPVFDTVEVADFLKNKAVLNYLAEMLSSFTKVDSHTVQVRISKGVWRRAKFSEMDLNSLARLCEAANEEDRFFYYRRAGDLCLFLLGMFPESVMSAHGNAGLRPEGLRRLNMCAEDYEEEGRRYYKLASEHFDAEMLQLSGILSILHEKFFLAKKPLNYISDHFVRFRKQGLFPDSSSN